VLGWEVLLLWWVVKSHLEADKEEMNVDVTQLIISISEAFFSAHWMSSTSIQQQSNLISPDLFFVVVVSGFSWASPLPLLLVPLLLVWALV